MLTAFRCFANSSRFIWICKELKISLLVVLGCWKARVFMLHQGLPYLQSLLTLWVRLCVEGTRWYQLSLWTAAISSTVWHLSLNSLLNWKHAETPWVFAGSLVSQLGKQCLNDTGFDPSVEQTQISRVWTRSHRWISPSQTGFSSYLLSFQGFYNLYRQYTSMTGTFIQNDSCWVKMMLVTLLACLFVFCHSIFAVSVIRGVQFTSLFFLKQ